MNASFHGPCERGLNQPDWRLLGRKSLQALRVGLILSAGFLLQGCALAMLNGAASSGGSGSTSSSGSASSSRGSAPKQGSRTAAQLAADNAISTSVRSRFAANPSLKTLKLIVDTHDGVVTLRGQAAKVEQRNAAQTEARAVKGVKSVQNFIVVR